MNSRNISCVRSVDGHAEVLYGFARNAIPATPARLMCRF